MHTPNNEINKKLYTFKWFERVENFMLDPRAKFNVPPISVFHLQKVKLEQ